MLDKPRKNTNGSSGQGCIGCPFAGDMKGFVPDALNENAKLFIFAQNPGEQEEQGFKVTGYSYGKPGLESHPPAPLIGPTGYMLEREYLPLTGFSRDSVSLGNALRCRLNHENELPPLNNPKLKQALEHCHKAHFKLPASTKLIVAMGEYALYALTQEGATKGNKIGDWRGYLLPFEPIGTNRVGRLNIWMPGPGEPVPVLATNHLAYLFRDPSSTITMRKDWSKVPLVLAGKWPKPLHVKFIHRLPWLVLRNIFSFDTEYDPESGRLIRYSAYDGRSPVIVVEAEDHQRYQPMVVKKPRVLTHNAAADIGYFEMLMGIPWGAYDVEDTMYSHALLWPDLAHDLDTLGSLYASINRWKHLMHTSPILYSAGDAVGTWDAQQAIEGELERDPLTKKLYYDVQLKLIPIIRRAREAGMMVHRANADKITAEHLAKVEELKVKAQALAGWPINLGAGPQVAVQLYEVEKLKKYAFTGGGKND